MSSSARMHADELDIDGELVRRLIGEQFPHWAGLPVTRVASAGTDNAMYRLGGDMVVRLPRLPGGEGQIGTEQRWLPRLAPYLPLTVPVPLALGEPGCGYGLRWGCTAGWTGATRTTRLRPNSPPLQLSWGVSSPPCGRWTRWAGRCRSGAGRSGSRTRRSVRRSRTWARTAPTTRRSRRRPGSTPSPSPVAGRPRLAPRRPPPRQPPHRLRPAHRGHRLRRPRDRRPGGGRAARVGPVLVRDT